MGTENTQLRQAWDFIENTGRSVFLTGKAGTGKTTFLKTVVRKSSKQTIVLAPTGVPVGLQYIRFSNFRCRPIFPVPASRPCSASARKNER